jgi:hypothetical protein
MLKEKNEYIFSFRLLEELCEEILVDNLWGLLRTKSFPKIIVSFDNSNELNLFDLKYVLIGKGFNFDEIEGKILHLIISINGLISYSSLIRNIILKFKNNISIDNYDKKNGIYDDVLEYYCGKKEISLFKENKSFHLKISPLSFFSSKRNEYIKDKDNYIVKNILDEDVFIDEFYLYFYFDGVLNAVKKERVNLI